MGRCVGCGHALDYPIKMVGRLVGVPNPLPHLQTPIVFYVFESLAHYLLTRLSKYHHTINKGMPNLCKLFNLYN